MDAVDELREVVSAGRAVIVVGTGVSSATVVDGTYASWIGLLEGALGYVGDSGLESNPDVLKAFQEQLRLGRELESSAILTGVAEYMVKAMGGRESPKFSSFLDRTIGELQPGGADSRALVNAIGMTGCPIITTNYDTLLEEVLGRNTANWTSRRAFLDAVQGKTRSIAHLHGVWNEPESVILTDSDYQKLLDSTFVSAVKEGVASLKSLVFVGFGAGLQDPTFESLTKYLRDVMPSGITHYRLCRSQEIAQMAQIHRNSHIEPVAFGAQYNELPEFVSSLNPDGSRDKASTGPPAASLKKTDPTDVDVFESALARIRADLLGSLSEDSLFRNLISAPDSDIELRQLVVEPTVLPVPYEVFVSDQESDKPTLKKLDPNSECMKEQLMVLLGDTHSGVTTTLKWMLLTRSAQTGELPVYVDVTRIHASGPRPIQNAIRKALRNFGVPNLGDKDPLPKNIVLALDNVGLGHKARTASFINDCLALNPGFAVLGTHSGAEPEIQADLAAHSAPHSMIYTGRVGLRYAEEIARRVSRDMPEKVAYRALEIAHRECLTRTPMSVTLLVIGLSQAQDWIDTASNTTFIDAYIDFLLGRGDPTIDSRVDIDSEGYSRILQEIAEHLVKSDRDSVDRAVLDVRLSKLFKRLDWQEDPAIVLQILRGKGLLVERGGIVRFKSSVFLHIFGARRAEKKPKFLKLIMSRPLRYTSIITHYAARKRDDDKLLKWAYGLLKEADGWSTPNTGVFSTRDDASVEAEANKLEAFAKALDIGNPEIESPSGDEDSDTRESADDEDNHDPWELSHEVDKAPYPSSSIENASLPVQIGWFLSLVSNVVRDSDLVEDPILKQRALERTLRVWGHFVQIMADSEEMKGVVDSIVDQIAGAIDLKPTAVEDFRERMHDSWALLNAASGIRDEMLTVKLKKAVDRADDESPSDREVHHELMLSVMLCQLEGEQWVASLRNLWTRFPSIRVVRTTVILFATMGYYRSSDQARLLEIESLIVAVQLSDLSAAGKSTAGFKERSQTRLRISRARHLSRTSRRKKVESGTTVVDALPPGE